MRIVPDHVVFQRKSELQGETHHQMWTGRAEGLALGMRKQDHSEIVFAGLQRDRGQVADVSFGEYPLEFREGSGAADREGLCHVGEILHSEDSALAVGEFADVIAGAAPFERIEKAWGESL